MSLDFISDTVRNQVASKLSDAFFNYYRYHPSPNEVNSWRNSLRAVAQILDNSQLHDHGILLEYQLPLSSKRLDCMVCGRNTQYRDNAVIIELKQWDRCGSAEPEKLVTCWVGGRHREILHPSIQVGQYQQYLQDTHSAFYEGNIPIRLSACSYLHNYTRINGDPLFAPKFEAVMRKYPLFDADGAEELSEHLVERVGTGSGRPVLDRIEQSKLRPSRKLMDYVVETIREKSPWILLDEQLVIFEKILSTVKSGLHSRKKQVIIVRGGPGTGKSVLAINLLADLLRADFNAHYATGSKAFTETLWDIVGNRARPIFRYFNSYRDAEFDGVDVLICDESHRIRETSNSRYTRRAHRSLKPQVRELLNASKVTVFLIDDRQVVRPNEIGSTDYIREQAKVVNADIYEYELKIEFRCAGSDGFVNWMENTLGVRRTANVIWNGMDGFDFRIVGSPQELEVMIRQRAAEGHTARVSAGFCWPWSEPREDGTLVDDVVIGNYKRPWDAKPGNWRLVPGIPPASLWARDPNGINQIGCVYNIQGFELDYVGVIWGRDLRYDLDRNIWIGDKSASADSVVKRSKEKFVDLVKNTYRVLLSRGMKGCYVYFMDKETERFVCSRLEEPIAVTELTVHPTALTVSEVVQFRPRIVKPTANERYSTCVPLVPLKAAAGAFSNPQHIEDDNFEWVRVESHHRLRQGMFVAQVVGKSMEPAIPDGSYCLFAAPVEGARQGKTVLVQLRDATDPETGERYTVKRYESKKVADADSWRHSEITLKPINPSFHPIVLTDAEEDRFQVVAELIEVLG